MAEVAAHEEGSRSHEEVQHASGQDRNIRLLPRQRLEERSGRQDGLINGSKHEMMDGLMKESTPFNVTVELGLFSKIFSFLS